MPEHTAKNPDETGTTHVVIEVPIDGRQTAEQVLEYRVGPACNYAFFWDWRNYPRLVLWGDSLDYDTLRALSEACHDLEREHSEMASYEWAKAADRMESAFLWPEADPRGVAQR